MASRVCLLVQWVDESYILPSYGIVDVETLACCKADLEPGSLILIRISQENPRRAKIIKISGNKAYILEQIKMLQRQDLRVNEVLPLCMHEPKLENWFNPQQQSSQNSLPHVGVAQNFISHSYTNLVNFLNIFEIRNNKDNSGTTNNVEVEYNVDLIPVHNNRVKIPARLLNDKDWSYCECIKQRLLHARRPRIKLYITTDIYGAKSYHHSRQAFNKARQSILIRDEYLNNSSDECENLSDEHVYSSDEATLL